MEIVVLVDIDRYVLLGHGLAAAFGEQQLDGVGAYERGGHHEENKQQEHQVLHGGVVGLDGKFISCFYHFLIVL